MEMPPGEAGNGWDKISEKARKGQDFRRRPGLLLTDQSSECVPSRIRAA